MRHRLYKCRVCGKRDRKQRLVGHLLKTHVRLDQVPYYCNLCNFRCLAKEELVNHITNYKRHVEEMNRFGLVNHKNVLQRSENPVDVESMMEIVEVAVGQLRDEVDDLFEDPDQDEDLPDWLQSELSTQTRGKSPRLDTQRAVMQTISVDSAREIGINLNQIGVRQTQSRPEFASSVLVKTGRGLCQENPLKDVSNVRSCSSSLQEIGKATGVTEMNQTMMPPRITSEPIRWGRVGDHTLTQPQMTLSSFEPVINIPDPTAHSTCSTPLLDEHQINNLTDLLKMELPDKNNKKDGQMIAESLDQVMKKHVVEMVNSVNKVKDELKETIRESNRELRAVVGVLQEIANEQRGIKQCLEAIRRDGTRMTTGGRDSSMYKRSWGEREWEGRKKDEQQNDRKRQKNTHREKSQPRSESNKENMDRTKETKKSSTCSPCSETSNKNQREVLKKKD